MKSDKKWEILHKSPTTNHRSLINILLKNRGIKTAKAKKEFFSPTPPEKISLKALGISQLEVDKAIKRLKKAKKTKEKVIVYGDYDADGICGTAIMWETLHAMGLNVLPYIPERFTEGYGLNAESIKKLKADSEAGYSDPKLGLIITVDHGIVAGKKIDVARELGVDVIITDHHQPGKDKPRAFATIHTTQISGSAVAWTLAREIARSFSHQSSVISHQLELVAIGTIADQIPLVGANRSLVKYGLEKLNETKRPGLSALIDIAQITKGDIGNYEVGFLIAPRLNAMGRLEHAMESLRLLCTKDKIRAAQLAAKLNRVNLQRQKVVDEVVLHALRQVSDGELSRTARSNPVQSVIVVSHESYHEGVIGLAAGKLAETFYRPAIVLSKKKDVSKASARSISGFNIIEAIRRLDDLILEGGGHPMAAGFSLETFKIEKFIERINKVSRPLLTEEILARKLRVDLEIDFNQVSQELVEKTKEFEPTGIGNPTPTFATKTVEVIEARVVGRDSKHLKLRLKFDSAILDGIAFGAGDIYSKLSAGSKINIAYNIEENVWNGKRSLQLKIKDVQVPA